MLTLSTDQETAHDAIINWWRGGGKPQTLTLGGLAGTGKTTTIAQVVNTLRESDIRIAFCAFTGKAALILRKKLEAAKVLHDDYAGTIHGLIYEPTRDENGKLTWERRDRLDVDLIVVDEASMIDGELYKDLCAYRIPILAVGDHGQLPPVLGVLNLMENPEIKLERIHRQAADNPIIQMSMRAREGKGILCGDYGAVRKVARRQVAEVVDRYGADFDAAGMVLCGTNSTRSALNHILRARRGFEGPYPQKGERTICLRNKRDVGLFNGLTGTITDVDITEGEVEGEIEVALDGGGTWRGDVRLDQFGAANTIQTWSPNVQLFDWGYALTVHKAQGSEAPSVVVFEECAWMKGEDMRRRWRYTAYTRAAEKLLIVG